MTWNKTAFTTNEKNKLLQENEESPMPDVDADIDIIVHLEALKVSFNKYISGYYSKFEWIRKPFSGTLLNESKLKKGFIAHYLNHNFADIPMCVLFVNRSISLFANKPKYYF